MCTLGKMPIFTRTADQLSTQWSEEVGNMPFLLMGSCTLKTTVVKQVKSIVTSIELDVFNGGTETETKPSGKQPTPLKSATVTNIHDLNINCVEMGFWVKHI